MTDQLLTLVRICHNSLFLHSYTLFMHSYASQYYSLSFLFQDKKVKLNTLKVNVHSSVWHKCTRALVTGRISPVPHQNVIKSLLYLAHAHKIITDQVSVSQEYIYTIMQGIYFYLNFAPKIAACSRLDTNLNSMQEFTVAKEQWFLT